MADAGIVISRPQVVEALAIFLMSALIAAMAESTAARAAMGPSMAADNPVIPRRPAALTGSSKRHHWTTGIVAYIVGP